MQKLKITFLEMREPTPVTIRVLPNRKRWPSANSIGVHFSSRTDEWSTPQWLYNALDKEFHFTLDPCATQGNAKCDQFFTREQNGLIQDWGKNTAFVNPPYGRAIRLWIQKAAQSSRAGATVVALVPARPDTCWWHTAVVGRASEIRFLKGRIKFGNGRNSAPFPSAIIIFRPPQQSSRAAED